MKMSKNAKNAFMIGSVCAISYFAVYIAKNILSAVTPMLLVEGFDEKYIGTMSSAYFVCYAVGQLINGAIGDKIKARYMLSLGLLLAGISNILIPIIAEPTTAALVAYASMGFFLAMIYGPMTKVVSENTEPIHATRCSLGYTFASFFGSPTAGALAALIVWQNVFFVGTAALWIMAVVVFVSFLMFERRGIIKYGQYEVEKEEGASKPSVKHNLDVLIKHRIVKFALVAVLTGIVRTSVVFWLPTYIHQYLGFSPKSSATAFTIATLAISVAAFVATFIFERIFKRNIDKTLITLFVSASLLFLSVYFVKQPIINIVLMVLAIMSSNGAATMLWSVYCPSLRDTGMVSSATGFLDFMSYMAAATANLFFAHAVEDIGWDGLILVWFGFVAIGVIVSLPYAKLIRKKKVE